MRDQPMGFEEFCEEKKLENCCCSTIPYPPCGFCEREAEEFEEEYENYLSNFKK